MTTRRRSVQGDAARAGAPDPYRELFERSADAILIIEGDRFVDCNAATVEMLRFPDKAAVLSTHPSELSPSVQPDGRDSFEKANEMMAIAFEHGSHRFEWDHKRFDEEVFPVEVLLTAVQRGDERILHVVWRDISERKKLEAQLRHAQKIDTIGKLAGGVAHDFNNLLVAIIGNGELLARQLTGKPELLRYVQEILDSGDRAAALVRQLLTFSRKQERSLTVFDVGPALEDINNMLHRLIGEHVDLVLVPPTEPLLIKANRGEVEQVIANLVTNARDAMPDGGTVTVETRRVVVASDSIGTIDELQPGPYVAIVVSDTGVGMSESTARQAIDPFFTTKEVGKGTGLGLSTAYGIAKQGGGTLEIRSLLGHGTSVKVFLPLTGDVKNEPTPAQVTADATRPLTNSASDVSARILLVEDDDSVAHVVVRLLESDGFQVERATNGEEALAVWRSGAVFDLLVSDVVMPKMSGPALVANLRKEGSSLPVLFISGYTNNALTMLDGLGESVDLLEKPFARNTLMARVRRALDRKPVSA